MPLFHVPSLNVKIEKLAARTPGRLLARSSICRYMPVRRTSSLYPAELASTRKRITFSLLKPVSTFVRFIRLRTNSPAATSKTSESATCEITKVFASGPFADALGWLRPSFSESVRFNRVARNAGIVPNKAAVASVTPRVNNSRRMSIGTFN